MLKLIYPSIFLLTPFLCKATFKVTASYEQAGISSYQNADKSIRVVKRKQSTPLKTSSLNKELVRKMAQDRLKSLKFAQPSLSDVQISSVSDKVLTLSKKLKAYMWSGSYKDKKGRVHFFKEYISSGYTWNVFSDKKKDLNKATQIIKGLIKR